MPTAMVLSMAMILISGSVSILGEECVAVRLMELWCAAIIGPTLTRPMTVWLIYMTLRCGESRQILVRFVRREVVDYTKIETGGNGFFQTPLVFAFWLYYDFSKSQKT